MNSTSEQLGSASDSFITGLADQGHILKLSALHKLNPITYICFLASDVFFVDLRVICVNTEFTDLRQPVSHNN